MHIFPVPCFRINTKTSEMESMENFSLGHDWVHPWNPHGLEVVSLQTHITRPTHSANQVLQALSHFPVMLIHSLLYIHKLRHHFISTAYCRDIQNEDVSGEILTHNLSNAETHTRVLSLPTSTAHKQVTKV
jgi:hypothetical protein